MSTALVFITIGAGCIIAAIVGGGIKMQHLEVKEVQSLWRQFLLGAVGVVFAALGFAMDQGLLPKGSTETNTTATDTNRSQVQPQVNTAESINSIGANVTVTNTEGGEIAELAKPPPAQPRSKASPEITKAVPGENTAPSSPATERPKTPNYVSVSSEDLLRALRFTEGARTGNIINDSPVRRVTVSLALSPEKLAAIRAVRYNFYHSDWHNPKHGGPASAGFPVSWNGWGCISHADVIATLKSGGEVKADYSLCDLWENGRITN